MSNEITKRIAFAGNPNVGKSTVFNALTGMKQHTGNWAGKTVETAKGFYTYNSKKYCVTDLPGTYSLMANSKEERCARDYICFENPDKTVIVCDATSLERNLNLALQIMEITDNVILCINMIDEAKRKKIKVDYNKLSDILGVPVIPVCARDKKGLDSLKNETENNRKYTSMKVKYPKFIENAINDIVRVIKDRKADFKYPLRWLAIRLLCEDKVILNKLIEEKIIAVGEIDEIIESVKEMSEKNPEDIIASAIVMTAEGIYYDSVTYENEDARKRERNIDMLLTNKWIAFPLIGLLLGFVLWLTIWGANYPSDLLGELFTFLELKLIEWSKTIGIPPFLYEMLFSGMFRVVGWIVSVMLPPMAIFFPLFTLMEDFGLLPRIAFNLDGIFKKCNACGKQSLTMCMGFGCNAAGVTGCRIIDSERERLIGIITNSFVPCNGRFPAIIAVITMFFVGAGGFLSTLKSALILTSVILLGIIMTFLMSKLLSVTFLKGETSSYTIELPPFRRPQIGKVIVRSIFDRTLFVLGRALVVAAPAGLLIWLLANISLYGETLLQIISDFLNPFGMLLGLDGVIILAFILGFPANEIVIPIILMGYLSGGTLTEASSLIALKDVLLANGWSILTAINMIIMTVFHFPCSTTILTIKKETGSLKWTFLSFILPTLVGILICIITNGIFYLL